MATVKLLSLADGGEVYYFIGRTWYGTCTTSASTQTKSVSIQGFDSSDLLTGTRVIVKFTNAQHYGGTPYLNVSSTGSKYIKAGSSFAGYNEWDADALIAFVYDGTYWVIEGGDHATGIKRGTVTISGSVTGESNSAVTPAGVQDALITIMENQYHGDDTNYEVWLNTTTPSAELWDSGGYVVYDDVYLVADLNTTTTSNRILKVTYGDIVTYIPIRWNSGQSVVDYEIYSGGSNVSVSVEINLVTSQITLFATPNERGAYPFKVEFYNYSTAGFVPYPIFKDTVGDIETLLASI